MLQIIKNNFKLKKKFENIADEKTSEADITDMKKNNEKEKNEIYISSKEINSLDEKLKKNNNELANIFLITIQSHQ